jgi:hypothetical protein
MYQQRISHSINPTLSGDPDGESYRDCQHYGLVLPFRPQPRGRSRRVTALGKVALPPSLWPEIAARVWTGESLRSLAREYGVSHECIRRSARTSDQYSVA